MLQIHKGFFGNFGGFLRLIASGMLVLVSLAACSSVGPATQGEKEALEFPKVGELPRDKPDQLMTPAEKDLEIKKLLAKKKAQGA